MSDERVETIRNALTFSFTTADETHEALTALDSLEAELTQRTYERDLAREENKELEAELTRLHGENERLRDEAEKAYAAYRLEHAGRTVDLTQIGQLNAELTRLRQVAEAAKDVMRTYGDPDTYDDDECQRTWDALRSALSKLEEKP